MFECSNNIHSSAVHILFQINKSVTKVDLLSFANDLEARADQLVSLIH